ncbi:unnamed protein product [Ceutorhynchus assimilis]|uniref:DUF8207 domain-containing protein n=1 Tax=Ceutorhynchus assimilis TaxID=467358 RepID=A0A9N9MBG8_9CUCU|nr:unnamed protein product [Ceutorhynchus assimilis]
MPGNPAPLRRAAPRILGGGNQPLAPSGEINPFARRDSITRSPIKIRDDINFETETTRSRANSLQEDIGDAPWTIANPKKKRKFGTSPETQDANMGTQSAEELNTTMELIQKQIGILSKIVNENDNTKKEIKEISRKLQRYGETLKKPRIREWMQRQNGEKINETMATVNIHAQHIEKVECREIGTQTMDDEIVDDESKISECDTYQKWEEMANKNWSEEVYTNTEMKVGSPMDTKDQTTKVVWVGPTELNMEKGIQKIFRDKFPELLEIQEEFGTLEQENKIKTCNTGQTTKRKIVKITHNDTEEEIYRRLSILKKEGEDEPWIGTHQLENIDTERFRKMVEAAFHGSSTKVMIYTKEEAKTRGKREERKSYALVVEAGGETFAETLKSVKTSLKDIAGKDSIQGFRSTREGRLLITMDKDKDAVERIQKAIQSRNRDGQGRVWRLEDGRDKETLHIRGIDAVTDIEEVKKALGENLQDLGNKEYKLSELRPTNDNTQTITLTINKTDAETLILRRTIKIGLLIEKLSSEFKKSARYYDINCMRSRPSYVDWYYNLAEKHYGAASACNEYLINKNLFSLLDKLTSFGFDEQIADLKDDIADRESRKAVRDKCQALKLASSTAQLEKAYRPITQPLKEFITNIGKAEPLTFKEEEEFNPKEEFSTPKSSYKTSIPTREKTRKSGKTPILPFEQPSFFDMSINRLPSAREVASIREMPSLREMPPIREEVTFESSPQSSTETIGNLSDILEQTRQSIQTYVGHPVYLDWLSDFHELPRTYIDNSVKDTEHKFDHNYGIVHDLETNNFFLGSSQIPVNLINKDIKVLDILYPGTPGLYELLFKKEPVGYKKADLDNYMDILTRTNAYRRNNNPNEQVQGNSSVKYVTIIGPYLYKKGITKSKTIIPRPVFEKPVAPYRAAKKTGVARIGKGLILKRNKKSTDYVYWDNVNELVNRLRILLASKTAGHNGYRNEIISIIEELKEAKVIL